MSLRTRRPRVAAGLVAVLTGGLLSVIAATPAHAAQTIGFPTFNNTGSIPQPPVGYNTGSTMQAIYDAESSGTDFWMDRLLGRSGNDPAGTWLMTRGRGAYMNTHTPSVIGFGGNAAYWDNISSQGAYTITPSPGTFTEQSAQRFQAPSYWRSVHTSGSIRITVTKFITHNNVLVTNMDILNSGTASATVSLRATSPYAATGSGT